MKINILVLGCVVLTTSQSTLCMTSWISQKYNQAKQYMGTKIEESKEYYDKLSKELEAQKIQEQQNKKIAEKRKQEELNKQQALKKQQTQPANKGFLEKITDHFNQPSQKEAHIKKAQELKKQETDAQKERIQEEQKQQELDLQKQKEAARLLKIKQMMHNKKQSNIPYTLIAEELKEVRENIALLKDPVDIVNYLLPIMHIINSYAHDVTSSSNQAYIVIIDTHLSNIVTTLDTIAQGNFDINNYAQQLDIRAQEMDYVFGLLNENVEDYGTLSSILYSIHIVQTNIIPALAITDTSGLKIKKLDTDFDRAFSYVPEALQPEAPGIVVFKLEKTTHLVTDYLTKQAHILSGTNKLDSKLILYLANFLKNFRSQEAQESTYEEFKKEVNKSKHKEVLNDIVYAINMLRKTMPKSKKIKKGTNA